MPTRCRSIQICTSLLIRKLEKNSLDFRRTWKFFEEFRKKAARTCCRCPPRTPTAPHHEDPERSYRPGSCDDPPAPWVMSQSKPRRATNIHCGQDGGQAKRRAYVAVAILRGLRRWHGWMPCLGHPRDPRNPRLIGPQEPKTQNAVLPATEGNL